MSVRSIAVAVALLVLSGLTFWPTWNASVWRGTEARRVQIAREMRSPIAHPAIAKPTDSLESWWVPRLGGEPTLAKPPLAYWALAATEADWLDFLPERMRWRLPSLLAWWLLGVLVFRIHLMVPLVVVRHFHVALPAKSGTRQRTLLSSTRRHSGKIKTGYTNRPM